MFDSSVEVRKFDMQHKPHSFDELDVSRTSVESVTNDSCLPGTSSEIILILDSN